MLRDLVYGYFMALGLLVVTGYSELVQMPTLFNILWLLALGFALLLAIPVIIYSLWSRDRVLWLLASISVAYGFLVLPLVLGQFPLGQFSRIVPILVLKVLDGVFVALCIGVPLHWFYKRRKVAQERTNVGKS